MSSRLPAGLVVVLVLTGCGGTSAFRSAPRQTSAPEVREFGFIRSVDPAARTIAFDPAEWLTGDAANKAAAADGVVEPGEPVPNDYYVRNPSTEVRTLKLVPFTRIRGSGPATILRGSHVPPPDCDAPCERYPVSLEEFFAALEGKRLGEGAKFWVTTRGVAATAIAEQYTP